MIKWLWRNRKSWDKLRLLWENREQLARVLLRASMEDPRAMALIHKLFPETLVPKHVNIICRCMVVPKTHGANRD